MGRDGNLLPPLILSGGEFALARELPPAVDPSWINAEMLLLRVAEAETGVGARVYELSEGRFSPLGPVLGGQGPAWLHERRLIALRAGPGNGFERLGIYGLTLERAQEGPADAGDWELLSTIPIEPHQLSPDGLTFAFATAAQENQQRDIQAINADGSDPRTIVATPQEEYAPVWTADGDLLFLRRELLDPGQEEAEAAVEVVQLDIQSGEETVLSAAPGITALASCSSAG